MNEGLPGVFGGLPDKEVSDKGKDRISVSRVVFQ